MRGNQHDFPIVGIGASAGGLDALRELVKSIPRDSGMAFVIVQHLSPDHPSIMDQLLSAHAEVPVHKIEEGMSAAPNAVFVIPAGPSLTMEGRRFRLHKREPQEGVRTPIDLFFTSLADNFGPNAFCVVLSGTGSDGTLGLRAVKAAGGFAAVQSHDSARFPSMPDSAASTGLVDFTLRPEAIPPRLLDVARHRMKLLGAEDRENLTAEIEERLPEIVELIGGQDGHDFSQYKSGTLVRRIERRMSLLRLSTFDGLLEKLRDEPIERQRLLQDFLIGVTQFFRDEEAFDALRDKVVRPLLDGDNERYRIWVPGCSTGEEALSIAMLFLEEMEERGDSRPFQVFGTDIDTAALTRARAGVFPKSVLSDLSERRRERFFTPIDDTYQVNSLLRERCVFAPHNLVQDPPFSRLDLVSCRNLLIYLTADIQESIIHRFHYALNDEGYLFLGPSESLGRAHDHFLPVDRDARLFVRNDERQASFSALPAKIAPRHQQVGTPRLSFASRDDKDRLEPSFEQEIIQFFLRETAAPIAVIDRDDEVVYLSERMGSFVQPTSGLVSTALDQFLARDLRLPVRSAIEEARNSGRMAAVTNVVVEREGARHLVDIDARPVPVKEGCIMVTLQPVRAQAEGEITSDADERQRRDRDLIDRELVLTKQQLQTTRSNFETTEMELRTSNEELLSMNEELQSSNEELETSREELQSINEELETVNAELGENNRLLTTANSDLKNLFESTNVASLFLDQNLCVRRFTPPTKKLFGIQDRDVGRPIQDLAWRVSYDALEGDAEQVRRTLQPVEREVRIEVTDETFVMQIRAYRTVEDKIDGCVITFFDVTNRKRQEKQLAKNAETLAEQYAELESLYHTTPVGLNILDKDLRYLRINERLAEINGFPVEAHIGRTQDEMLPEIDEKVRDIQLEVLRTGEPMLGMEVHGTTPAAPNVYRDWVVDYYPVKRDGEVFAVGSCVTEVTAQKRLERELRESEAKLRRLFDNAPAIITLFEGPDHVVTYLNAPNRALLGERNMLGLPLREAMPDLEGDEAVERFDEVFRSGKPITTEEIVITFKREPGGEEYSGWFKQTLQPWFDGDGSVGGVMSFAYEITDSVEARKSAEESRRAIRDSEQQLRRILDNMVGFAAVLEPDGTLRQVNEPTVRRGGVPRAEVLGEKFWDVYWWTGSDELRARIRDAVERAGRGEAVRFESKVRIVPGELIDVDVLIAPLFNEDGQLVEIVASAFEITERVQAEQRQALLLQELQHRVKNSMAITAAVVQFSARRAQDVTAFAETLSNRLQAIARTHDLLTANDWRGSMLRDIAEAELAPYGSNEAERTRFEGDDVRLSAKQSLALGLAFHELATNAAKYGALSVDDGSVAVISAQGENGEVCVTWIEENGPAVVAPGETGTGFGSFLLEKALSADIRGSTDVIYDPSGLRCVITFVPDHSAEDEPSL